MSLHLILQKANKMALILMFILLWNIDKEKISSSVVHMNFMNLHFKEKRKKRNNLLHTSYFYQTKYKSQSCKYICTYYNIISLYICMYVCMGEIKKKKKWWRRERLSSLHRLRCDRKIVSLNYYFFFPFIKISNRVSVDGTHNPKILKKENKRKATFYFFCLEIFSSDFTLSRKANSKEKKIL